MTTTTEQVRYSAASPAEAPYLRAERKLRTVACYGTIALLMFGPLAFGAVEAWSTLVLELGSAAVFALWVVSRLAASRPSLHLRIVHLPPMLFLALVGVQLIFGTTAYRYLTVTEFLKYVAYALVFFIATDLFRTDREMRRLCLALAAFGFAMAVFGCLQQFTSDEKLYWTRTPRFGGAVYGPYVNRNHYAGLMELLIPFALVGSFKLDLSASKRVVLGFATVLMTTTIFLCQSRGGMVAFALQCVFVAVVLLVRSRSTVPALTVTCALLLTVGLGLWLSS
ncbi:MAG TPA: hypothetical protein VN622_14165, partial [Clostridia bacterium]|nr:hypothetical protein [Clostridia bacterium]